MNKQRRKSLQDIIDRLYTISDELTELQEQEQECYDNLPENIQQAERGQEMEQTADSLQWMCDDLSDLITNLEDIL